MALTIVEWLRAVNPNIGLVVNLDGSYRIGVEDINSDEILLALLASEVDLAALEVLAIARNVDLAAIETDTGFIRAQPIITPYTGTGTAIGTLAPGVAFRLLGMRFHLGSALAAAETLTVTLDDGVGGAYDTVLFSSDLGTPDIRDVVIEFPRNSAYEFNAADQIVIALSANAGADTWGCKIIHELI